MAEDEDDKTRRNVVLLSTLILLGAWLDVKPGAIVARMIGETPAAEVSLLRVWLALGAVLFYVAWRFQHASSTRAAMDRAQEQWQATLQFQARRLIWRHLRRYSRSGKDSPLFNRGLAVRAEELTDELIAEHKFDRTKTGRAQFHPETEIVFHRKETEVALAPHETGHVAPVIVWPGVSVTLRGGNHIKFRIAGWRRYPLKAFAAQRLCASTQAGTELAAPVLLAAAATAVVSFRIASLLIAG
jgi:hypothetical protein